MIFRQKRERIDELIILHCFFGSIPFDIVVKTRCLYVDSRQMLFHFDIKIYLYSEKICGKEYSYFQIVSFIFLWLFEF